MEDKLYIVMYLATPMMIYWSKRAAMEFLEVQTERGWGIVECPMESLYMHVSQAMSWARKNIKEGDVPVQTPDPLEALHWAASEIGEAFGAFEGAKKKWRRNHPEKHTDDDASYEATQAIIMLSLFVVSPLMPLITRQLEKWGWKDLDELPRYDPYDEIYNARESG